MSKVKNDYIMTKFFLEFFEKIKLVKWEKPQDIISSFRSADFVKCRKAFHDKIVFNLGHNRYRMICGYHFGKTEAILFVKFVGTHEEYDLIDVCKVSMFK